MPSGYMEEPMALQLNGPPQSESSQSKQKTNLRYAHQPLFYESVARSRESRAALTPTASQAF